MSNQHRVFCKRQHRVLGHFLAIQAWLKRIDCIVLERRDLQVFLNLERFKSERIEWLKEDLLPWFEHSVCLCSNGDVLDSLFLSRTKIEHLIQGESRCTAEWLKLLNSARINADLLVHLGPTSSGSPDEADMVKYLAVLNSGLEDPTIYS